MPRFSVESSPPPNFGHSGESPGQPPPAHPALKHEAPQDCAKASPSPRLLGGMFLKFPSAQHKQETCSKSPGSANSMLQSRAGESRLWERSRGGRGRSKLSRRPLNHPCLFFPDPERKNREGGRKESPLWKKLGEGEGEVGHEGAARLQSEPPGEAAGAGIPLAA